MPHNRHNKKERVRKLARHIANTVLDFLFPRYCHVCGNRLMIGEKAVCVHCNMDLPRTFQWDRPHGNDLAKRFWGKIPLEKAVSYMFFHHRSNTAELVYAFKYHKEPYTATTLGEMMAHEIGGEFFDDIDCIIPVPLNKKKQRKRGYNQSECLARGITRVTGLPIVTNAVVRRTDTVTQTMLDYAERQENTSGAFSLTRHAQALKGRHCLLVDDIITTGATVASCAREILKVPGTRISVLSLGSVRQAN